MSHIQDSNDRNSKYVCAMCHRGLSDRYLECTSCGSYLHYKCGRFENYSLERCLVCSKRGSLVKRVNLELDQDRRNTI